MSKNQILRAYSIKEVSKKINTPTGTIRQWEKDLAGLLVIPRTQQGARYYTENEITLLNKIKEMRLKNVSKDMIRTLLEESINRHPEPFYEPLDEDVLPPKENSLEIVKDDQKANIQEFHMAMEAYKQELLLEFKNELSLNKSDIIAEIKNEISTTSLQTVKEVSKSIQRSNDKRKVEAHEVSEAIIKASEHTSETFATLSKDIAKHSEAAYERISNQMGESSKTMEKENKNAYQKVSKRVKETQNDIKNVVESLDAQQDFLIESINELKQSTEEIQQREEIFQSLLSSYRQAAATKSKKKWWQLRS